MDKIKSLLITFASVLVLFSLSACEKNPDDLPNNLAITPSFITIDACAHEATFELTASFDWRATCAAEWITITPSSGDKNITSVSISVSVNTGTASRSDSVFFTSKEISSTLVVTQQGTGSVISSSDLVLNGADTTFTITPSDNWTIELTDTKAVPSWFSVSPMSGSKGSYPITITKKENNPYTDDRNAFIKLNVGTSVFYVTITQKAKDAITASSDKVEMSNKGGNFSVSLSSNVAYEVEISPACSSWVHKSSSGSGTKAMNSSVEYFSVSQNTAETSRQGYIFFKGNTVVDTVTVFQNETDILILSQRKLTVEYLGGDFSVNLRSNVEYSVTNNSDWITQSISPAAVRTDVYNIHVLTNTGETSRSASIIFTDRNNSALTDTLKIVQGTSIMNSFTTLTSYGLYDFDNKITLTYTKTLDQLVMISSDKYIFRMVNPRDLKYFSVEDIPSSIKLDDAFTLSVLQNYVSLPNVFSYSMSVVKIDGNKVWLFDATHNVGIIIKK